MHLLGKNAKHKKRLKEKSIERKLKVILGVKESNNDLSFAV